MQYPQRDGTVHELESQFGQIDVLVNSAAIFYDTWQKAIDADLDTVNQAFRTNLLGPWRLIQKCIPIMKRNKYGRGGGVGQLCPLTQTD